MQYARSVIRPGRKVFEIVADVVHKVTDLGSEEQLVTGGCAPYGTAASPQKRHFQNQDGAGGRPVYPYDRGERPGRHVRGSGPLFLPGRCTCRLYDAHELLKETQHYTVSLLKPGADRKIFGRPTTNSS